MTSASSRPRPQQVTTAGWVVVVSAVLLMASAFDTMTGLHSLDTRAMLNRALGAGGLGLSLDQATGAMHVAVLVAGAAAAAAAVLGIYVLRGDRVARVALGAVAVVVALSAPFADMFFGALVAVGAGLLWSRPAREWFDGKPAEGPGDAGRARPLHQDSEPPAGSGPEGSEGSGDTPPHPGTTPSPQQPPPHSGFGQPAGGYPQGPVPAQPTGQPSGQPASGQPPYGQPPYGQPVYGQPAYGQPAYGAPWGPRPPGQVRTASIITWVLSGIVIVVYGLITLALLVQPDDLVNGFLKRASTTGRNFTAGEVKALVWSVCIVFELWAVAACILARQVVKRRNGARITLIVSASVALVISVLSTLTLPLAGVYVVGCGIAIGQLASRPARAWTASTPAGPSGPPGPPPGGYGNAPSYPQQPEAPQQQPQQPPAQRPPSNGDDGGQPPVW